MEVASLSSHSIRLKSKQATIIVDPSSTKTPGDAILLLHGTQTENASEVEGSRVVLSGPGDYEVGGIKISTLGNRGNVLYMLHIDGILMLLAQSESFSKLADKGIECQVAILLVNDALDQSDITRLSPQVVVVYGNKASESIQGLTEGTVSAVNKYQISVEKLPEQMQVVLLG